MSTTQSTSQVHEAVRDGIARTLAAVGLIGVALIHLLDINGKFQETPYMFWMYVALMAACIVLAGALVRSSDPRVWLATAALPATVIVGFVLSRTTGLPQASDDIGNWSEPLSMASLFVESSVVGLSCAVLLARAGARAGRRVPRYAEAAVGH